MVDLTQCELCGRTIPATEHGCAYCDSERGQEPEREYVPMARRWLLGLFVLLCALGSWLGLAAGLPLLKSGSYAGWLPLARAIASGFAAMTVLRRWPQAPWIAIALMLGELGLGVLATQGMLPARSWTGGWLSPLWSVVFLFYFSRPDVRAHFQPRLRDRLAVLDLVREVQKAKR